MAALQTMLHALGLLSLLLIALGVSMLLRRLSSLRQRTTYLAR